MRIGVNTLFLVPGEVGGSERYLREVLRGLVELPTACEFVLFTNLENDGGFRAEYADHPRVQIETLSIRARNRVQRVLREQWLMPRRIRTCGVDVLWSAGQVAILGARCRQVMTVFDMQYKRYPEDFGWIARSTIAFLLHRSIRVCERILTISSFSRQEILRFTNATDAQVTAIPLAAHPVEAEISSCVAVQKPYLLTVANSYPHKNLHRLVEAFGRLSDQIPHDLVIVGKARRGEGSLIRALGSLPEPDRVRRLSGVSNNELVGLYRDADVFCFPSLYEGFGLPVLEAMHVGTPVVMSEAGSLPEVGGSFATRVVGQSVESIGGGIQTVLGWDSETRRDHVARARGWAQTFTWERTAEKTLRVLTDRDV